jgi:PTS system nitrogen regulatory IIA component
MSVSLVQLLSDMRTDTQVSVSSKKRLFEIISERVNSDFPDLSSRSVFSRLLAREKMGSTGLGHGIAIPHCRVENVSKIVGVMLTLDHPIDFEAPDNQPVDIVFALLVPEDEQQEHLNALAKLASLFNESEFCSAVRKARSKEDLRLVLLEWEQDN